MQSVKDFIDASGSWSLLERDRRRRWRRQLKYGILLDLDWALIGVDRHTESTDHSRTRFNREHERRRIQTCMGATLALDSFAQDATRDTSEKLGRYRIRTELDDVGLAAKNLVWVYMENCEEKGAVGEQISESEASSSDEEFVNI